MTHDVTHDVTHGRQSAPCDEEWKQGAAEGSRKRLPQPGQPRRGRRKVRVGNYRTGATVFDQASWHGKTPACLGP